MRVERNEVVPGGAAERGLGVGYERRMRNGVRAGSRRESRAGARDAYNFAQFATERCPPTVDGCPCAISDESSPDADRPCFGAVGPRVPMPPSRIINQGGCI